MNYKQIIGIVVGVIGIALIIFSIDSMKMISNLKGDVGMMQKPMSGNPIGRMAGEGMEKQVSQYDMLVKGALASGILLVIVGSGLIYFYRKR